MGIIKKYKIIYERNIIISILHFKEEKKKKVLYHLSSSGRNYFLEVFSHVTSQSLGEEKLKFT